jgi:hypothetical protein
VEEVAIEVMQAQKGVGIILDYGNCKFKYGEFEFGSE